MNFVWALLCSALLLGALYAYTVAGQWVGDRSQDRGSADSQLRLLGSARNLGIGLALIGTAVIYVRFPLTPTVSTQLPTGTIFDVITAAVGAIIATITGFLAVTVVTRRLEPKMESVSQQEHTVPDRLLHRITVRFSLALLCVVLAFELIRVGVVELGLEWVLPVIVVCYLGYSYLGSPYSGPVSPRTRDPTADERTRIERCFDRLERTADRVVIFEDDETVPVWDAGRKSERWTWIEESALEERSDEDLSILLSQAREKNRLYFWELLFFLLLIYSLTVMLVISWGLEIAGLIDSVFLSVGANVALTVVGLAALLIVNWVLRRRCYLADDITCERFGPEPTVAAYERTDVIAVSDIDSAPSRFLRPEPSSESRIDRLATRHGIDRSASKSTATMGEAVSSPGSATDASDSSAPGSTTTEADLSTTVGFTGWTIGIALCVLGAVLQVAISLTGFYPLDGSLADDVISSVFWAGIPLCLYLDTKTTRAKASWPQQRMVLVAVAIVPVANLVVGCWYLWQRRLLSRNGAPSQNSTA